MLGVTEPRHINNRQYKQFSVSLSANLLRRVHNRNLVINILLPRGEDIVLDPKLGHSGRVGRVQVLHVIVAQMVGAGNYLGR